jgi:hypothetical protein
MAVKENKIELLRAALIGLEYERKRLDSMIAGLRARLAGGSASSASNATAGRGSSVHPKRRISAAARKRMAAGQRKRWAAFRKAKGGAVSLATEAGTQRQGMARKSRVVVKAA